MRKHFLILFLLTLLPLASHAENIGVYVNAAPIQIKYGEANPLANAVDKTMFTVTKSATSIVIGDEAVKNAIAGLLRFSTERTPDDPVNGSYTFTLSLADNTQITTGDVEGNTYTITLQQTTDELEVIKATTGISVDVTPAFADAGLSYDGRGKNLLAIKGSGKIGTTVTNLPLEYIATEATVAPADGYTANGYMVTDAKTYHLYYRVAETDNYAATEAVDLGTYTVEKGNPQITQVPTLSAGWTYDGKLHQVISEAATSNFGTIKYKKRYRASEDAGWGGWQTASDNIETGVLKGKSAGQYQVLYFIEETENWNAVANQIIETPVTVSKAPLSIAIKQGLSKEYAKPASADPALVYTYDGLVNNEQADDLITDGDLIVPVLKRVAGENAGVYPITKNNPDDVASAKNYEITADYTSRYFAITSKALAEDGFTFTVDPDASKVYTSEGIEPGLSEAKYGANDLTEGTDFTLSYLNNVNVGTNTAVMTITGKGNFKGTLTRNFSITKANIYIHPKDASKVYGTVDPGFDENSYELYTSVDKVAANKVDNSVLGGTVELAREAGANVGTYKIYVKNYTLATEDHDNYKVDNVKDTPASTDAKNITATFKITAPTEGLVLHFKSTATATKVYGENDPEWSINDLEATSGLVGGDTWDDVKASLGTPVFALTSQNAGQTQVKVTNLASPVYPSVTVTPLEFNVQKRKISVVVKPQTVNYGVAVSNTDSDWDVNTNAAITENKGLASNVALGINDTKADVLLTVKTENAIGSYAPGSTNKNALIAQLASNSNYELLTETAAPETTPNTWGTLTINAAANTLSLDDTQTNLVEQLTAYNDQALGHVYIKFGERSNHKYSEDPADAEKYPCLPEMWTTMVLPFDISVADLSKALGYAIVNVINSGRTEVSGTGSKFYGKLTMTGGNDYVDVDPEKNDTKLAANKPFMLKLADGIDPARFYDFGAQTIKAPTATSVDAGGECTFVGTYAAKKVTKDDKAAIWFMNGNEDGWQYIKSTSSAVWTILPFEAYIDMSAVPTTARNMTFYAEDVDGTVTAINGVTNEVLGTKLNAEGWYTINGMKLNAAPTEKGIYINNGKKVIIK